MAENLSYHERLKLIKLGQLPKEAVPKPRKAIPRQSEKQKALLAKEKEGGKPPSKLELEKWFYDIQVYHCGTNNGCYCQECGKWIPIEYVRHATAHLLAKKLFKSIATHPLNYLILCAGNGCHYSTDRLDKFVQMKMWPEAARRIKILLPLLPIDELRHVSSQLLIALDNTP